MARDDLHFRLRIPEDLKAKVEAAAAENHRSMTAEIIARLEGSFESTISPELNPQRQKDTLRAAQDLLVQSGQMINLMEQTLEALSVRRQSAEQISNAEEIIDAARKSSEAASKIVDDHIEKYPNKASKTLKSSGGGGGTYKTSRLSDPLVLHNKPKRKLDL